MTKILFAEDDAVLGRLVKEAMSGKGYEVLWAKNGTEALQLFKESKPDICVLDVMMPGMDGFTLAQQVKELRPDIPVLFLTARSQTADIVKGFESGGNDYLKKPFSLEELFLRIKELLRRSAAAPAEQPAATSDVYEIGRYQFYPSQQLLVFGAEKATLSYKESELLKELVKQKNQLMDRKEVLIKLWGDDNFFHARNMDVYIVRLRKYLSKDPGISIVNIRGRGYKLIQEVV
ncbi:response regulator transcription factor [Chitinophagaceae bacterium MMS25-I14]